MLRARHFALATLAVVVWCNAADRVAAVLIYVRGNDQPIRGYLLRENEHVVVVQELLPDGTTTERTVPRSQIEDLIRSVDPERLAALDPARPEAYREYAEELAEKRKDPEAQVTAIRLYQIAAALDPERLGPSCLLGMIPLARDEAEQRRFRAMAYLSDPRHDPKLLQIARPPAARSTQLDPAQAEFLLKALRALRQGRRRDALAQARRSKLEERLPLLTDTITYDEFERACEAPCAACARGRQTCPTCGGARVAAGSGTTRVPCPTCGGRGETVCAACGGNFKAPPLDDSLRRRIVQLEWLWLPGADEPAEQPPAARPGWSPTARQGRLAPVRELAVESLTEFNPRHNRFRDGTWVE
ncbi:MAG: hypothetical protein MUF48_18430 [Pirellulaceae bacterium]|jgi:hypothetical protein|nr:hypothetical protein [Pirellulaceae bacterium]